MASLVGLGGPPSARSSRGLLRLDTGDASSDAKGRARAAARLQAREGLCTKAGRARGVADEGP